ncbi:MAG: trypsin-like serine protease with C-terminal domain [Mycobacterium sp.]|nr:trypsin-like serine protease with C-terminal domain [Mycobacterium sp.]
MLILRGLGLAAITAAVGVAVALLAFPPDTGGQLSLPQYATTQSTATLSAEQIATKVLPSVVTLTTELATGESHEGSGVVLTSDGLIMTNDHVVAAADDAPQDPVHRRVALDDGRTATFSIVGSDPKSDVAVVRAEGISGVAPISVGSSGGVRVGQPVVAVGSPLGLTGTVTVGIISGLNRPVFGADDGNADVTAFDAIQTDAALNPGNSGGALVDMNGDLIGMNSAMASLGGLGDGADAEGGSIGIGFAIPADHATRIANELIATGTASHAWLGAQVGTDMDADPRIVDVANGSPAAAAGLRTGTLVTKIDDQEIRNVGALCAAVQSQAPGARVAVGFIDPSGNPGTVLVTLGTDQGQR